MAGWHSCGLYIGSEQAEGNGGVHRQDGENLRPAGSQCDSFGEAHHEVCQLCDGPPKYWGGDGQGHLLCQGRIQWSSMVGYSSGCAEHAGGRNGT